MGTLFQALGIIFEMQRNNEKNNKEKKHFPIYKLRFFVFVFLNPSYFQTS
jgi:hypothetical protein